MKIYLWNCTIANKFVQSHHFALRHIQSSSPNTGQNEVPTLFPSQTYITYLKPLFTKWYRINIFGYLRLFSFHFPCLYLTRWMVWKWFHIFLTNWMYLYFRYSLLFVYFYNCANVFCWSKSYNFAILHNLFILYFALDIFYLFIISL